MSKTMEQKYKKMSQVEHILELPDTYIGSTQKSIMELHTFCNESNSMVKKNINVVPGLFKIYDEILVNANDQYVRLKNLSTAKYKVTTIKVNITEDSVSVMNDGDGIDIQLHKEHGIYIPELIFGYLLTSTNYDKDEEKVTGGKNGYGAKLTNIYSTEFTVETVDSYQKKKYIQTWSNNMDIKSNPKITKCSSKPYTKITFKPDFKRFGMNKLDEDILSLMTKRVYDMTASTGNEVEVYLNDTKIVCNAFEKYVNYYIGTKTDTPRVYEKVNERWEVVIALSNDDKLEHVSFVNGIYTFKGGKHVDNVANHIAKKLQHFVATKGIKRKKHDIKTSHIKDNMWIFLKSIIVNPSFDSQTKEYLTTPSTKFGSKFEISDKFIEQLSKIGIVEKALKLGEFKENSSASKTDGKKRSTIRVPKLDDANWAGTIKSKLCTLILTEGDSAKAFAISGLSIIGRDRYGVFPLRGKMLNVRDCPLKKASENIEINNIKKILGLQQFNTGTNKPKEYTNTSELRYGSIMILTDQDVDGSHIKGLFINFINVYWPTLTQLPGFIISLATPIVKAKKNKINKIFYTTSEFKNWEKTVDINKWDIKYYKGLGTSTSKEAKECFLDIDNKKIIYQWNEKKCKEKIELAFSKNKSDQRKDWLKGYNKDNIIEQSEKNIYYADFIDKDLIHFSNYDNERSLPSICDGLKPSQRKIMFSVFKRNLKKGIKVAQLTGYVSEQSCYHHGETSLNEAIINMAQDYVGSNNINYLYPDGQFGTRLQGGKDSGAPRYIWTYMSKITNVLFNPNDLPLLKYNVEEGQPIEPVWYLPIIPTILINGSEGIGTGFSTKIPQYNPLDIIENIRCLLNDKPLKNMKPWYRGFNGKVELLDINQYGEYKYYSCGNYKKINNTTIEITELPIGTWTDDYKDFLDKMVYDKSVEDKYKKKQCIVSYKTDCTESTVKFTIRFNKNELDNLLGNSEKFEQKFGLRDTRNTSTTNMNLYNSAGRITKYCTTQEIMNEFYIIRLAYYGKRKEYMLNLYKNDLNIYEAKIKFIEEFIVGTMKLINEDDNIIHKYLEDHNYPKFQNGIKSEYNYDYLINMQIRSLTKRKIEELRALHEKRLAEYNSLQKKSDKDLWNIDLEQFIKVYKNEMKDYEERYNDIITPSKKNNKKITIK
jgi:DNA topoisomerase II